MYIIIALSTLIFAFRDYFFHSKKEIIFRVFWVILTLLLCLRYGQGTDYFNYEMQYNSVDAGGDIMKNSLYHGEIGWYIVLFITKKAGISFSLFVAIVSMVEMFSLKRFFDLSPYRFVSVLIFLPTYYMTYCFSAMRQGVVMCLFLGFGISFLYKKRIARYLILVAILSLLHLSAIILAVLPFFYGNNKSRSFSIIGVPIIALAVFLSFLLSREYISQFSFSTYINDSASIGGILIRILMVLIVVFLHSQCKVRNDYTEMLYRFYLIGFSIFLAFSFTGTFAQRLTMPFKAMEIALIPLLMYQANTLKGYRKKAEISFCFIILSLLMGVEYIKNVDSYIDQGNYHASVNALNYPYVSILDKLEIYRYRDRYYGVE